MVKNGNNGQYIPEVKDKHWILNIIILHVHFFNFSIRYDKILISKIFFYYILLKIYDRNIYHVFRFNIEKYFAFTVVDSQTRMNITKWIIYLYFLLRFDVSFRLSVYMYARMYICLLLHDLVLEMVFYESICISF